MFLLLIALRLERCGGGRGAMDAIGRRGNMLLMWCARRKGCHERIGRGDMGFRCGVLFLDMGKRFRFEGRCSLERCVVLVF